jgi:hypothetical protein
VCAKKADEKESRGLKLHALAQQTQRDTGRKERACASPPTARPREPTDQRRTRAGEGTGSARTAHTVQRALHTQCTPPTALFPLTHLAEKPPIPAPAEAADFRVRYCAGDLSRAWTVRLVMVMHCVRMCSDSGDKIRCIN